MFSRFFIHRPIFATVVSIVTVLAGLVTLLSLPISQYPDIAPPTIQVTAFYPGADPLVISDTVATPIEQEVNGVEGMLYMLSNCASDGSYVLTVTFETGVDLDMANVLVQNRVSTAMAKLPEEVQRLGVTTKKRSSFFVAAVGLVSSSPRYDDLFLHNYVTTNVKERLSRIAGVGDVQVFGVGEYSMRIWLDPTRMEARNLTTGDVVAAVREQNVQVAAGGLGRQPSPADQNFEVLLTTKGRLTDVEEFGAIVIKTEGGRSTYVRDVARIEVGTKSFVNTSEIDGQAASLAMIYQLPGANMLEITGELRRVLDELSRDFPAGVEAVVAYDASDVVKASIAEIVETLLIAALLVILTVYVFLQDWRATLVPAVTIPVSLVGTFAVMGLLGFSINTLTLFGLVLAIGIVVDDAIVVVENVTRNLEEGEPDPKKATEKAMVEVSGPVVATTLVLLAVFVPTAFMGGLTGVLYNQFGLTIATATVFSSVNALTLSPALCGLLLRKPVVHERGLFGLFNTVMDRMTALYGKVVALFVRRTLLAGVAFLGMLAGAYLGMVSTPGGFLPDEDQGYCFVEVVLPDGASLNRTKEALDQMAEQVQTIPGVEHVMAFGGFSFLQNAALPNVGAIIAVYEHWDERQSPELHGDAIVSTIRRRGGAVHDAMVLAFAPPALPGLGNVGGFELMVEDRAGVGTSLLQAVGGGLAQEANADPVLTGVFSSFRGGVPQLRADVDREKVKRMGIPLQAVFDTLNSYLGSTYVNDFTRFGRVYQVKVQAEAEARADEQDVLDLRVRNPLGETVPLGTLLELRPSFGPMLLQRYNLYPITSLKGNASAGHSSGEAAAAIERLAGANLPAGMGYEWTGMVLQQKLAGNRAPFIFGLAVLLVYLVLAAQYESWATPLSVILAVPMGLLGAMVFTLLRGLDNNLYTQVGLVLLIGLVCKNSILIVEFAREQRQQGVPLVEAALNAARLRFRAILMTALSFVLGTLPLLIASGAGAGSRVALGTAVFGGMVLATLLGVVLTPALYRMVQGVAERLGGAPKEAARGDRP